MARLARTLAALAVIGVALSVFVLSTVGLTVRAVMRGDTVDAWTFGLASICVLAMFTTMGFAHRW